MIALLTTALHVCLTIIAFDAYRRWAWRRVILPSIIHMVFALSVLLVEIQGACVAIIPVQAVLVLLAGIIVGRIVSAPDYAAKRQLRAWEVLTSQRVDSMRRAADVRAAATGMGRNVPAAAGSASPRPAASGGTAAASAVRSPTVAALRRVPTASGVDTNSENVNAIR